MLVLAGSLLAGFTKPVPDDGMAARTRHFDNLNNYRYCGVFLFGGDPLTKDLSAAVYNYTDKIWAKVDSKGLKEEYGVMGVFKNGLRFWLYGWIELPVGK
jgi:hypothetical protein